MKLYMRRGHWAELAVQALRQGQCVQVQPRGHSMQGRVNDGDVVTLAPCDANNLQVNDIVLVQVPGRRYSHVVLHLILQAEPQHFLIGSQ